MGKIAKIHEMLKSKQCSCTELTKSYLDEIEKSNGELNAYVNITGDEALKAAKTVHVLIIADIPLAQTSRMSFHLPAALILFPPPINLCR